MKNKRREVDYDVVILGGGMAGLSLARQLMRRLADKNIRLLVVEQQTWPAPEAAFKVGESTVEIGAWYLDTVLGLGEHIKQAQLPKYGLRFFFNQPDHEHLDDGLELGLSKRFPNHSFQLDRGRLENYLAETLRRDGVSLHEGCRELELQPGRDGAAHEIRYRRGERRERVRARWLVDATGRRRVLANKLDLKTTLPHKINAAWFRLEGRVKIDDWGDWREMGEAGNANHQRWLSTIHLMNEGAWVWLIPLSSETTSVGIVADPRFHPLDQLNSHAGAMDWLQRHQPVCAGRLAPLKLMDFKVLKHFSYGCKQMYSADRWALTGEAAMFPDPFYSPGADFIAIGNLYIEALIERDLRNRPITALAEAFNQNHLAIFHNTMRLYRDQYSIFGNAGVMTAKIIWDYTTYWSFVALSVMQGRLTDIAAFAAIAPLSQKIGDLNARMQAFFKHWNRHWRPLPKAAYIDQSNLHLIQFNQALTDSLDAAAFRTRIAENLEALYNLAAEITGKAIADYPDLADFQVTGNSADWMTPVWRALSDEGNPPDQTPDMVEKHAP